MSDAFARVPELMASHVLLAMAAMALGIAISLPLAVAAARHPRLGRVVLGAASLIQTIPSLALLALFYPMLLALRGLVGDGLPALGFLPALLALTLYAILPVLRNAVTALTTLDPALREAADGIGMTAWQKLWLVEAPIAAPVVMAGIRTAATWTIGAATLSTTVGQPSLGDLIFAGLQTQNWALVLAGCIGAAALALGVDLILSVAEGGMRQRKPLLVRMSAGTLLAAICAAAVALAPAAGGQTVVVGAKGFSEQFILARLIGQRLEAAGYRVEYREGLGSAVAFGALTAGDIDVSIDYSGTIWTNQMQRSDVPPRDAIVAGVGDWVGRTHGVTMLGSLGFENAYAFAMRGDDARQRGIVTLADLAAQAPQLDLATDVEFLERPEWRAVRDAYGLRFKSARPYQPTFMYRALASGRADVIPAFSSDGRIAADKLTILRDPKGAIPGYDAILMVAPDRAQDARFQAALRPLIGKIPVEAMREANLMVDRDMDKRTPEEAARWLAAKVGL
ncbi:osmoprotectant transport system permease protein [Sphingomonas sp. BE123]|uniref:ABC transporter permease/substrate-binding protein n=1 Tax=Sphingomonas sp. BE123 TaxID=2817842 RepID=UPI002857F253|nr:ABC transporter permease/substrate-binding protein [Sphingomonas sp. BE123]MDR6852280.1 osmoprotectant transport system permease protein [Sphingomonas sp. BE123]